MKHPEHPASQPPIDTPPGAAKSGPGVDSKTLLQGRRELPIRHGRDTYRLRLTASNKLILTK